MCLHVCVKQKNKIMNKHYSNETDFSKKYYAKGLFDVLDGAQDYKKVSKRKKRWIIERLITHSNSCEEVQDIENCAKIMSYPLTQRQIERIIEKLVYLSDDSQLEKVMAYANSKSLLSRFAKARFSNSITQVLGL